MYALVVSFGYIIQWSDLCCFFRIS